MTDVVVEVLNGEREPLCLHAGLRLPGRGRGGLGLKEEGED